MLVVFLLAAAFLLLSYIPAPPPDAAELEARVYADGQVVLIPATKLAAGLEGGTFEPRLPSAE